MKPLQGYRILDLTNVLAGPFCCHQLAHMGAEVIKVETPRGGDLARQLGADPELNEKRMGVSFLAQNTGKRSITINLKTDTGKQLLRELARDADALVENFRPGVMDRLELGYSTLKRENPDLVYCAISGFGQDGPLRHAPAYDQIIQGMSGVMAITGDSDSAPLRVGYPVADTIGGMTAAFAVSSALARQQGERGCLIDVSMLESVISTMGWVVSNLLIAGQQPLPMGNDNFTASPSGAFRTADGLINIAANKQEQFEAVCRTVGREDLIADARFSERQARLNHRAELSEQLEAALATRAAADWVEAFNAAGVPAGPVLSVADALEHPQVADRGMFGRFENVAGVDRDIQVARPGIKINGEALATDAPPPQLGAQTAEILGELGYSADDMQRLTEEGAI